MTKQELKKAIENGESVWVVFNEYSYKNDSIKEIDWMKVEGVELRDNYLQYFNGKNLRGHYYELIFKTKVEAEHYFAHANITRTETLPFLTWEEFKNGKTIQFIGKGWSEFLLKRDKNTILLIWVNVNSSLYSWELTEYNFYEAYNQCVKLFKGE